VTPILIDGGEELPIELDDIRVQLRIPHTSEDSVIKRSFGAAMEFFEEETLRAVTPNTYELQLDSWPCGAIVLERAPVREIVSISYLPADGSDPIVLDPEAYPYHLRARRDGLSEIVLEGGWPHGLGLASRPDPVTVRFTAGYHARTASEGDARFRLPRKVEQALILLTGHWFENREETSDRDTKEIKVGARAIMKQMRIFR
jgi:uncharacterized phiE125 gp8 family phage protein